ncbi:MAG: peptide-methionine (S)-S-oxide reductase MsrA [Phyllobacterium sp.]
MITRKTLVGLTCLAALATGTLPALTAEKSIIFAGGCFWSVETNFDHVPGVISTASGYTGGHLDNPTYKDVITETTGHREAVRVTYDPAKVSYETLLDVFWHQSDPTDATGQFCDKGESYTSAIYTGNDEERNIAERSKAKIAGELKQSVATLIKPAATFYPAEEYHQNFAEKNPAHYTNYRVGCRRDASVAAIWGDTAYRGIEKH